MPERSNKGSFIIYLVIFVGILLRLAFLSNYPLGLNSDEARIGYRATLLSTTGKDETGRRLPLYFSSFTGYQLPLPSYLVAASFLLFPPSVIAIRLPFALIGCLGLISFYGLSKRLLNSRGVLWATLAFALSPGAIFLSRTISSWMLYTNLILIISFIGAKPWRRKHHLLVKFLSFFLVAFAIFLIIGYLLLPGAIRDIKDQGLGAPFDSSISTNINQMRGEEIEYGIPALGKLFFNKSYLFWTLAGSTFENLNLRLFFASGDQNPLHGPDDFGPLSFLLLPLFIIGSVRFLKSNFSQRKKFILITIFLLSLLPSILDKESPNQEKLMFSIPLIAFIIGWGASRLSSKISFIYLLLFFLILLPIGYISFTKPSPQSQNAWHTAVPQLAKSLKWKIPEYDKVYLSDSYAPDVGSDLAFLWQVPLEPVPFSAHSWIDHLGNVSIGNWPTWSVGPSEKVLFVLTPQEEKILNKFAVTKNKDGQVQKTCYQKLSEIKDPLGTIQFILSSNTADGCSYVFHEI